MKTLTIKKLASAAGVSVRTLQYYDEIGLLKPHRRADNNYRVYGDLERLRLQQILFYRQLGYELDKIREILDQPGYDLKKSLEFQRAELKKQQKDLDTLLKTLDRTLTNLNNIKTMNNKELYEGFPKGEEYREEAAQRWGEDSVKKSEARVKAMGKERFEEVKAEGDAINRKLADLMDKDPGSDEVQEAIRLFHQHMTNFIEEIPLEMLSAWGQMYVDDPRFRANYEKYAEGLAEFLNEAIQAYCERGRG